MRIVMWSGPRNLSTALMRSFGQRSDTAVVDEPFYAAFLAASGKPHPMRDDILASGMPDWRDVARACAADPVAPPVRYEKHMTHHMLPGLGLDWMAGAKVAFLIRDPAEVAASYAVKRESCDLDDIGIVRQWTLFEYCAEHFGPPPVINSADIRRSPEATLRALCTALDLPFQPAMLSWPPGPRPTDGVWARHWYAAVENSTGFAPPSDAPPPNLPPALQDVVEQASGYYRKMAGLALRPDDRDLKPGG
jgi:hypothetical protein